MNTVPALDQARQTLLESRGNLLVLGGPGSGKTTISLLKASAEIQKGALKSGQKLLFLSFARATIGRVAQHAQSLLSAKEAEALEINTYHGFAWNLLRSHGYLLRAGRPLQLLPPPEAAARLSALGDNAEREEEKHRLFEAEGLLHFDLFAQVSADLLRKSQALCRILCDVYPTIILDEFQDTNEDEWALVQCLGQHSRLIALADAEQRIYEFRGADPQRIAQFIAAFTPGTFDFGSANHRSNGTDIAEFGNDLLSGANRGKQYRDVDVQRYGFYRGFHLLYHLKLQVLASIRRRDAAAAGDWSLAILVPTKQLMLQISDYLSSDADRLPKITHEVALDTAGPSLAASVIAALLEGGAAPDAVRGRLLSMLCVYVKGRKSDAAPSKDDLELVAAFEDFLATGTPGKRKKKYLEAVRRIVEQRFELVLSGTPTDDWLAVRTLFESSGIDVFMQLAIDAKYLRLLHKGATLRSRLGEIWRDSSSYAGAEKAVRDALVQEHFTASVKEWKGIHVMTIHKSKGKEFTEVIVYEAPFQGRILRKDASDREAGQSLLALRVAVTRAMKRTTIMTPKAEPCSFL